MIYLYGTYVKITCTVFSISSETRLAFTEETSSSVGAISFQVAVIQAADTLIDIFKKNEKKNFRGETFNNSTLTSTISAMHQLIAISAGAVKATDGVCTVVGTVIHLQSTLIDI